MFSNAFEKAVLHSMIYEVGGFFKLTPSVEAGLIDTKEDKKSTGYVNDPHDRGGETKFGIAKNANPDLDITALTWEQAKKVYYDRYWLPGKCDAMNPRLAFLHYDICVNHGPRRAAKFLQRALQVDDDGVIGPITLNKANKADPIILCDIICNIREKFYKDIVSNDPSQQKFLRGWLNRSNDLRKLALDPQISFV